MVPVADINRGVGIDIKAEEIAKLLTRMCLKSQPHEGGRSVEVEIPPTRAGGCSVGEGGETVRTK